MGAGKLSALKIRQSRKPGYYGDGGGLWLQISAGGTKSWVFRFTLRGRSREMGLGGLSAVSLSRAREAASGCRSLVHDGIDPIENRRDVIAKTTLDAAKTMTFDDCAMRYIAAHEAGWKNKKHAAQWHSTLQRYVSPVMGHFSVQSVDVGLVMKVLEPIWTTKTETASRVRGRIEAVIDWATARGYRTGDNPARWRGHIENLLPHRSKVQKVKHHAALPYREIADFMSILRKLDGTVKDALEFVILTATRTEETIGAMWNEVDIGTKVWIIPGRRTKTGAEHRVPLSSSVVTLLKRLDRSEGSEFVFPGAKENRPLSNMAMLALCKRMWPRHITVHGFRSTFRDWASEQANFPNEVAEMAIGHAVSDKVEAAYRRGDLFEKRKQLMHEWDCYCGRR